MKPTQIEELNADPLSWVHPSNLPQNAEMLEGNQRAIINKLINEKYSLNPVDSETLRRGEIRLICENWKLMRSAIHYMACYRHRALLMQSKTLHQLEEATLKFINMNVKPEKPSKIAHRQSINIDLIAKEEVSSFVQFFPYSITSRLFLMLNKDCGPCKTSPTFNLAVLKLAVIHARNYYK